MSIDPATELSFEAPRPSTRRGWTGRCRARVRPGPAGAPAAWGGTRWRCAFGVLFVVMVADLPGGADLGQPRGPHHRRRRTTSPTRSRSTGKKKDVVSPDGVPIGPTWHGKFFLGADTNGRDIMVRLLYGGRNSLLIGVLAAVFTVVLLDRGRPGGGLLPGLDRLRDRPHPGHHLGLPGGAAGGGPRHRARARRAEGRARSRSRATRSGSRSW